MSKNDKQQALVPRLRFPEFRDAPEWNSFLLEQLKAKRHIAIGRGMVISHDDMRANPGSYPVYSSSVINDGLMGTFGDYMFDEELISWSIDGGGHFFHRPKHKFSITNVSGYIRILSDDIVCSFLAYQLQQLHASKTFDYQQKAHPSVICKIYSVLIPERAEQQKIADCLGSLDDLIAAEGRKLAALREHKKGLMQQLFPREGETRPRLRFPEFRNAGEWVKGALCEFGEIVTGMTPNTKEARLWDGDILFITPTDISEDGKYQFSAARAVRESKGMRVLPPGSVVYTCIASIGKMALTVRPSVTNQQINAVIPNKKSLGEFIYYALASLTPWIKTIPASSTLPIINKSEFSKIEIVQPQDLAEQQKIADCLSSLDALIDAQVKKLDALRTHKRGLMQQLFPSPEDTGV